jgi:hypothetical protein
MSHRYDRRSDRRGWAQKRARSRRFEPVHDDALVVDEGPVAAAQIHNLVLERVVAADDRVLPGYVITGKSNRIVDGTPYRGSILYCPLKRFTRGRIHTKFSRHLTFRSSA